MLHRAIRVTSPGITILLIAVIVSCGISTTPATTPLRIAAASDLQSVLPKLTERFQAKAGITCTLTFGASGQLAQQIRNGAPFDLFLSANQAFVRDLARLGVIQPESVQPYARGSLVLAVYRELGEKIKSVEDLALPEVKRIALANPDTAPYGKAGKQALVRLGLWDKLKPKIVVAESVRQALIYAQKGDAEAALVGRAIADVPEVRTVDLDLRLYDPITQALGIVADSACRDQAEQFTRFVLGDDGQSILREFGFRKANARRPGAEQAVERE
jgi:molybdate transport system substrate-binding protein